MQGGRGKSGWCKHKWTHVVKYEPGRFGKLGFRSPTTKGILRTINVGELERLSQQEGAAQAGGAITRLDLSKLGYEKLLGEGRVGMTLEVIVNEWSKTAEKKVQESGGRLVAPEKSSV